MPGIRNQLSARGMALRSAGGKFHVSHVDGRYPETASSHDLYAAFTAGLRMAGERESTHRITHGSMTGRYFNPRGKVL